jgi:LPXTG-motif cell wall-anchored protein
MIRKLRLLPAAVLAVALLATPVQAGVRHHPAERAHRQHARHRHAPNHARHASASAKRPRSAKPTGPGAAVGAGSGVPGALSPNKAQQTAHAASDTTVTIADFSFSPASITIQAGDTVTWVNNGPSAHTATANNGAFNTGVLQKGHSASHTFTKAGTYSYICSIHPFMHGTVVVLANSTSTTTPATTPASTTPASTTPASTTPASTTPASTTPASTSTAGQLPMTGFAATGIVLAGLLLTGAGIALRRRARA